MARVTVRLTERMAAQLEEKASENGMNRARFVRNLIADAVDGTPVEAPSQPTHDELLVLLAEKARQGNVAAIRSPDAHAHLRAGWEASSLDKAGR